MATFYVTATKRDPTTNAISDLCTRELNVAENALAYERWMSQTQVAKLILDGHTFFTSTLTNVGYLRGSKIEINLVTDPNNTVRDNLRSLPTR